MGIMLLDRSRFEGMFRAVDVQPDSGDMLSLAVNVRNSLSGHVSGHPRKLRMPLGNVAIFGNHSNRISIVPEGWRGYSASYAAKGDQGEVAANAALTREINSIVGEVRQFVQGGVDGNGNYTEISTRPIERQTPHVTIATKTRGGQIGNAERADLAGQIGAFMPPELRFYDPIVHMNLVTDGGIGEYLSNIGLVDVHSAGMFVRTPQADDASAIGYEKITSGRFSPVGPS
jgi:hypothetical protein